MAKANQGMIQIKKALNDIVKDFKDDIIEDLRYIGEECINIARTKGDYNNITGNLRSSIGYVIIDNGEIVTMSNSQTTTGTKGDGKEGVAKMQQFLNEIAKKYSKGLILIVCAGMEYAYYVEAIHGKDVLDSARLTMEKMDKEIIQKYTKNNV